jgi:DUF971 family protein
MQPPREIRLKRAEQTLEVTFAAGETHSYPAEYLRVESPSAEVQGHGPGQRRVPGGKRDVGIKALEPVGNYAIRVVFDDGHDTGIFSWEYLRTLAREKDKRWAAYLEELGRLGLQRNRER